MRVPRQPAYHLLIAPPEPAPAARRRWPRWVALAAATAVLATAAVGWTLTRRADAPGPGRGVGVLTPGAAPYSGAPV
ncbi:hypothetical protein [Streptomyces litchfieldiae]|uniref:Uncharacterized protein n=1 Tax=Streptomyces litchfieldiae TaxID=3075543 RepID=A0ABU2N0E9_9ACTN|nr:hypothetical protein [Streptomyces sp. DSM 44938]MDT0346799.1 hypothetical protein [Streptomyces sp. DSM 44938]